MRLNLCPACAFANPTEASFCQVCGEPLAVRCRHCATRNVLPAAVCEGCGAALDEVDSGLLRLPLDGAGTPSSAPVYPATTDEVPTIPGVFGGPELRVDETLLILRTIGVPAAPAGALAPPLPDGVIDAEPQLGGNAAVDAAATAARPSPPVLTAVVSRPSPGAATTPKHERRAAVRRARLARPTSPAPVGGAPLDVLVLDADPVARAGLCALLEGFGFRAHPAHDPGSAAALLKARLYVAAFLAIVLDGSDSDAGADLCRRVQQQAALASRLQGVLPGGATGGAAAAALIIVGSATRPTDRVRATMAGADHFLVRPVRRGDVARVLDACGVSMPADPRQG